jgi:hypothetical protein
VITLLLALAGIPDDAMKSSMEPVSIEASVSAFKQICYDPFPSPAASLAIIGNPALGLTQQPKTPSQAMQPGNAWSSRTLEIFYADADWLPRTLGAPQCAVTSLLAGSAVHTDVASAFAAALKLPAGKIGKNGPLAQSQWDMPGRNADKWRIFLVTQLTPSGTEVRATIMNLRARKK